MKNTLILGAALLSLSACGGGSSADATPAMPAVTADPFLALVRSAVAASSDSSEPAALDARAAGAPDDAEPAPLDAALRPGA